MNEWCEGLDIDVPRLEAVMDHREANTYSLLMVALLERGEPMTLAQVARRFEEAGIAPEPRALLSLQRCKPGRAPIYREGDLYHLDAHDPEADLWAFRLGLRPATKREPHEEGLSPSEVARRRRAARAAELAKMRRVLVVGFPANKPEAVALLDVEEREIETFVGDELGAVPERLEAFDILGAMDARKLLGALGFPVGARRVAELGPPQKTKKLNQRGRTLKLTTKLLIQGSCGISRPFGDPKKLKAYLRDGQHGKLRRRLAADAKSLYALYQYGRLHGSVRLRWGFLDEPIPAPWASWDETKLFDLKQSALDKGVPLEVVVGNAPGWADPWSRAKRAFVQTNPHGWGMPLYDEEGMPIDTRDVQLARL
ncbi:MAG: hypothetical protein ACQEXJ_21140 [Myxococcota bacterium]